MWIKDGKIYRNEGICVGKMWYSNPSREQFIAAGWSEYTPPPVPPPPKRYSKLKIIDALGAEAWAEKRAELEAAGVYEKFSQATYLSTDYPAFAAIYEHLTDEEKRILDEECLYDE